MTTETEALARQAVACAAWRLMPGMRVNVEGQWLRVVSGPHGDLPETAGVWLASESPTEEDRYDLRSQDGDGIGYPDLTDAATLGCLLALVREAYADGEEIHVTPISANQWIVHGARSPDPEIDGLWIEGLSEAAALVAALVFGSMHYGNTRKDPHE